MLKKRSNELSIGSVGGGSCGGGSSTGSQSGENGQPPRIKGKLVPLSVNVKNA